MENYVNYMVTHDLDMIKRYPLHTIELTVTPSLNKLHSNRWQMLNWKKKYLRQLEGYEMVIPQAKGHRLVKIIRCGSRMLDYDNARGGLKPMIDAFKEKGFIKDDSDKWLKIEFAQAKCKRGKEKTIVIIFREY